MKKWFKCVLAYLSSLFFGTGYETFHLPKYKRDGRSPNQIDRIRRIEYRKHLWRKAFRLGR